MRRIPSLLLVSLFLVMSCGDGSKPRQEDTVTLERELPELVRAGEITGLSIAVIREKEPVWTGNYGLHRANHGQPVRSDTLFEAASLSKPVFAYAVLRLAERGAVDLDTPIANHLSYERLEHDERYREITPRMVLTHSSGLPNWGGTPLEMAFNPGERFGYSGEGFVFLQKAVEKMTGVTLNELANQEVFGPLGMKDSTYVWRDELAARMATGHSSMGDPIELFKPIFFYPIFPTDSL